MKKRPPRTCIHCGQPDPRHEDGCVLGSSEREFRSDPYFLDKLQEKWGTAVGQIWVVGGHVVGCGDATDPGAVTRLLDAARREGMPPGEPGIMVTDPPYGVEYDPEWRQVLGDSKLMVGVVHNDSQDDWRAAWKLFPGDVAYVWHSGLHHPVVRASLESVGFGIRSLITWDKGDFILSRGHYNWASEFLVYMVRKGKTARWCGGHSETTVWNITSFKSAANGEMKSGHSTQKPLECMARPMRNHEFGWVYEPFLGSGTAVEAAQREGKRVVGLDIDPRYLALTLARMARIGVSGRLLSGV